MRASPVKLYAFAEALLHANTLQCQSDHTRWELMPWQTFAHKCMGTHAALATSALTVADQLHHATNRASKPTLLEHLLGPCVAA